MRLLFRNIVGARIARPLSEFVQNFGFAHFKPHLSPMPEEESTAVFRLYTIEEAIKCCAL